MVLIGIALIVRTLVEGADGVAFGLLLGVLFIAAGAGRLWLSAPVILKKQLGSPALFGIVQGFIAASIYFSTGLVAERALGLTWAVFLAGSVLFVVIVPCYVEGASLHQERGGATVIARYAFNELVSFIAGWAICLDYLILVALCAFASTDYLGLFWQRLQRGRRRVRDRRRARAVRGLHGDPRRRAARLRARRDPGARRHRAAAADPGRSGSRCCSSPRC